MNDTTKPKDDSKKIRLISNNNKTFSPSIKFRTNKPKSDNCKIPKEINEMALEMLKKYTFISDDFGLYEYDYDDKSWKVITENNLKSRAMNFDTQKFSSSTRRKQTAEYIIDSVKIPQVQWNNIKEEEIAFQDCLVNILTNEHVPYLPEMLVNIKLGVKYDPNAICPWWEKAITDWFGDQFDKIEALREFMAYTLMNHCNWKKAIYLYGPSGCGKSKVFDVIREIVGKENFCAIRLENMDDSRCLFPLKGKRANILPDVSSKVIMADGGWKTVVGGEPIQIKKMREDEETISPTAKHWIGGNCFPEIKDTSDGVYNRLIIISFDKIFEGTKNEDKNLPNKLKNEIPGIINWALKASKKLIESQGDFTKPKDNASHIRELSLINNPVKEFLEISNMFEKNTEGYISVDKFCEMFNKYHGFKFNKEWTSRKIGIELKKLKIESDGKWSSGLKKTIKCYIGIQEKIQKNEESLQVNF